MSNQLPTTVRLVEVGARDGLQNEATTLSVTQRVELIHSLQQCGFSHIEAGSMVSPKWVPQMAHSDEVLQTIQQRAPAGVYPLLVPNVRGMELALAAGVTEVAIFSAASESFCQKNTNCSIAESLQRFSDVMALAQSHNIKVRGYVSCVLGCPYEGSIMPSQVAAVARELAQLGCYEISLGDTIGVGTPASMQRLIEAVVTDVSIKQLAVHCHDTYGMAIANIYQALTMGVSVVDSAVAGLGGCPYAKGASGNVASEDVVYLLNGLNIECGIDLTKLIAVGNKICDDLQRPNLSRVSQAMRA